VVSRIYHNTTLVLFSIILFTSSPALISSAFARGRIVEQVEAQLIRVIDGDTIVVSIQEFCPLFGEEIGVRIRGIDAPELRSSDCRVRALAVKAKQLVSKLMDSAKVIELRDLERGKYFRLIADVYVDGVNVSKVLLEQGVALPYDGGKRPDWGSL